MARFYGWSNSEIDSLDWPTFQDYWLGITVVEAYETLVALSVSSYPHLKPNDQKARHKELHKMAYNLLETTDDKSKVVSMEEAARRLMRNS